MEIDKCHTAVLALHWLHDIVSAEGALGAQFAGEAKRTDVVSTTSGVLDAARAAGVPVVYTRVAFQPGYGDLTENAPLYGHVRQSEALIDGTPGATILDEVAPRCGDVVVTNNRVGGFVNSSLDFILRTYGIDTVLVTGVATEFTVDSTARQASDLGYRTILLADCMSGATPESHQTALAALGLLTEISTAGEAITALGG
nr:isochorismatase family cysteine hydrolase [Rhodococcus wratislaviensis]GLK33869.1 cysteine hydrolase [Rhodococcus wratislaviensis]